MENNSVLQPQSPKSAMDVNKFFANPLPDLGKAQAAPLELGGEYWTPESIGETRRAFFNEIRIENAINEQSGETVELATAYFVWQVDGTNKVFRNASKRLVGVLEACQVKSGAALEITYLGKRRNKNNSYMSDNWSVKPLIIEEAK